MTPLRAIWSEASRWSDEPSFDRGVLRIGRLLDLANRQDLVRWDELHRSIDRLGRRGRAGTRIMRAAAERRMPGSSATESRNEDRFEELLAANGVAPLERQVWVGGDRPIGRSDHRDPDHPLVVEVNGLTFHSTPSDQDADEERYASLAAAGFAVVVVWEDALWSNTASVLAAVAVGRGHARRGDPAVIHSVGCPWPHDPSRIVVGESTRRYRG
jgi:very-short-patch-repair endonuclease